MTLGMARRGMKTLAIPRMAAALAARFSCQSSDRMAESHSLR
jgi:hypothetical protein